MQELILISMLVEIVMLMVINKQKDTIKILENNWETAKKVIAGYDPDFAEYINKNETH